MVINVADSKFQSAKAGVLSPERGNEVTSVEPFAPGSIRPFSDADLLLGGCIFGGQLYFCLTQQLTMITELDLYQLDYNWYEGNLS